VHPDHGRFKAECSTRPPCHHNHLGNFGIPEEAAQAYLQHWETWHQHHQKEHPEELEKERAPPLQVQEHGKAELVKGRGDGAASGSDGDTDSASAEIFENSDDSDDTDSDECWLAERRGAGQVNLPPPPPLFEGEGRLLLSRGKEDEEDEEDEDEDEQANTPLFDYSAAEQTQTVQVLAGFTIEASSVSLDVLTQVRLFVLFALNSLLSALN
jgi:hypothetical protein